MLISSNVCTDLEIVTPFKDRFGLWEVPYFFRRWRLFMAQTSFGNESDLEASPI